MKGFGVHTSMWTMSWAGAGDDGGAARAIEAAKVSGMDFLEIALLDPEATDAAAGRALLEAAELPAVCSLGLPEPVHQPSRPCPTFRKPLGRKLPSRGPYGTSAPSLRP